MMDFSAGAGKESSSALIPTGQLAWAIINIKGLKHNSNTGTCSIEYELTLDDNQPFARRKIFGYLADPNHAGNSETYNQMGLIAITRILECGRGAGPQNPDGYKINDYGQMSGLRVGIKIGFEKGKDGYDDKNKVAEWLTPNPTSKSGNKPYQKLVAGEHSPAPASGGQVSNGFGGAPNGGAPAINNGFGAPHAGQASSPTPAQQNISGWGGSAPAQDPSQPAGWLQQGQTADDYEPLG